MFGKAYPYVELTLGKQQTKSATVKNNHNPEQNFESKFDVDQSTAENIIISVFDEGLGKDDSLGSTSLNISSIQQQEKLLNQWVPLENCKSGEVLLSAEFIPLANVESQKDVIKLKVTESGKESPHEVDIESKIRSARKAVRMDMFGLAPSGLLFFHNSPLKARGSWQTQKGLA